jgi:hypothetical protein
MLLAVKILDSIPRVLSAGEGDPYTLDAMVVFDFPVLAPFSCKAVRVLSLVTIGRLRGLRACFNADRE